MTTDDLKRVLGENVRNRRKLELRLTQTDLAEKCGWSQAKIAQIESGTRSLPAEDLATLATALGTTPAALVTPENFSAVPA